MPKVKQWTGRKIWQPAAVGSDETTTIFKLKKGQRLLSATARVDGPADASSTMTVSLGISGTVQGFIANFDPETATMVDGQGTLLANAGGYLATADIDVIVTYDQTTYAGTNVKVMFTWVIRDERY